MVSTGRKRKGVIIKGIQKIQQIIAQNNIQVTSSVTQTFGQKVWPVMMKNMPARLSINMHSQDYGL